MVGVDSGIIQLDSQPNLVVVIDGNAT